MVDRPNFSYMIRKNPSLLFFLCFSPLLIPGFSLCSFTENHQVEYAIQTISVKPGAEFTEQYVPLLKGKRVGLVINQSSRIGNRYLIDSLFSLGIQISSIFAPEHGWRGDQDAGATINDSMDLRTGAVIKSLYGANKKPQSADLEKLDVIVFDIQDVGARFYTFISTLFYVMEACAENQKPLIVLDRPNPNGYFVDGPVLEDSLRSFVGIAPIPIVHGCTIAELANMFKGEKWTNGADSLILTLIRCGHYTHDTFYELPIKPSPNLPTVRSVLLYPSLCLFEGTTCSVGRGTDFPFEVVGHPDFQKNCFSFVPEPNPGNKSPLYSGVQCFGYDFRNLSIERIRHLKKIQLGILLDFYKRFPDKDGFFGKSNFFDKLSGTGSLKYQIQLGWTESQIRASWKPGLKKYLKIRKKYLLYD